MTNVIVGGGISGLSFALFNQDKNIIIEKEFTKEDIIKMVEDSLVLKSDDKGLNKKDLSDDSVSPILKRNLKALKNMAETEGISIPQLVKMLKNE